MPLLKTLLRKLSLLYSLWLLWTTAVISQNLTTNTLDFPFTINFGNISIAKVSSTSHQDRGWGPKVFVGSEPAVFTLKDGILSSGNHSLGKGPQDRSRLPKNVYWVANEKKWPRLYSSEKHSLVTGNSEKLTLLYNGRRTMYARGLDSRVLIDISPGMGHKEGPEPTIQPVK